MNLWPLILCLCLQVFTFVGVEAKEEQHYQVLISKVVDHPALDTTVKGLIDALKDKGFSAQNKNLHLEIESAQANVALSYQIAAKFTSFVDKFAKTNPRNHSVVVGVGSLTAQSFLKAAKEQQVQLIFSSVTDPEAAGLVGHAVTSSVSGVSNFLDLKQQLQFFKSVRPSIKRVGFIYNPGEPFSISVLSKIEKVAKELEMEIVPQVATKSSEVGAAAASVASRVDALFVFNDNTALSAFSAVARAAEQNKILAFVSDVDAVKDGAVAALGPSQYQVGYQTGEMIARLFKGEKMSQQKIEYPNKVEMYLNQKVASKIGLQFSSQLLEKADVVLK